MNKVTYVLGAGFSQPLGLPVMSNFLIKSKDLYFSDPKRYSHFEEVFDAIEKLSVSKNYYDTDLFNIEEILSILEMGTFLQGKKIKKSFIKYIIDVIEFYTPSIKPYGKGLPGNWYDFIFGGNGIPEHFGYFVSNLFGIKFKCKDIKKEQNIETNYLAILSDTSNTKYAVVTLNYDLVLENVCDFINKNYKTKTLIQFNSEGDPSDWDSPPLLKLHGSTNSGLIVPPTWAKGNYPKVIPSWKNAYQTLSNSNHIRFIGYSLPVTDSYVKYLLKSAVLCSPHLKSIDVICKDLDGSVKKRYDDFIQFNFYRFANASTGDYLKELHDKCKNPRFTPNIRGKPVEMNKLESVHENFMDKYKILSSNKRLDQTAG